MVHKWDKNENRHYQAWSARFLSTRKGRHAYNQSSLFTTSTAPPDHQSLSGVWLPTQSPMTTLTRGLLFSLAALWVTAPSQAATAATHPGDMASTPQARVIVKLRRPVVMTSEPTQTAGAAASFRERILKLGRRAGVSVDDAHQIGTALHAARARGMTSRELARRLALQSDVEYAVEDQRRHATQVETRLGCALDEFGPGP